jgi:hypothetical protein
MVKIFCFLQIFIHIISPLYHNDTIIIMGQFQYLLFIFIVYF